jgi:hypothetical protein
MWDVYKGAAEPTPVHYGYIERIGEDYHATTTGGTTAAFDALSKAADWLEEQHEGAGNQ